MKSLWFSVTHTNYFTLLWDQLKKGFQNIQIQFMWFVRKTVNTAGKSKYV